MCSSFSLARASLPSGESAPGARIAILAFVGAACLVLLGPKKCIEGMRIGAAVMDKARRGLPPGLDDTSEGYAFIHQLCFNVYKP
jgi:hypothetical protein